MDLHLTAEDFVKLTLAVIGAIGGIAASYFAYKSKQQATLANRAVNGNQPGSTRLYDLAVENHQKLHECQGKLGEISHWYEQYQGGPLDTGPKVEAFVKNTNDNFCLLHQELKALDIKIDHHACPYSKGRTEDNCDNPPEPDED